MQGRVGTGRNREEQEGRNRKEWRRGVERVLDGTLDRIVDNHE
jgi:hypothetical protein